MTKRARRQAQFAWDVFERQSARPRRGRCQAACEGKPLREKQQIGARAVAETKRQQSLGRLLAAHQHFVDNGVVPAGSKPTNRVLAAQAGLSVRTLQKHRAALQAAITATEGERRCKDKKKASPTPDSPQALSLPVTSDQPAGTPQHTRNDAFAKYFGNAPNALPPLALLTIVSPARVLSPNETLERPPTLTPSIPPYLAGLVLFPSRPDHPPRNEAVPAPTDSFVVMPPLEARTLLAGAGFTPAGTVTSYAIAWTHSPAPLAPVDATAAAALSPALDHAQPVLARATRRGLVPGFLEARAAQARRPAEIHATAPAPGRRTVRSGLVDQADEPEPSK